MSDQQLAALVQRGDRQAAHALLGRYQNGLFGMALRLLRNREDAAEVTQETMVKALANIGSYDAERPFTPWLYRIARNLCIDHHRRHRRTDELDEGVTAAPVREEGTSILNRRPDTVVHQRQVDEALHTAMEDLGPKYREIIDLYHFQHLSYREIADHLGLPDGTVMNRLFRARQKLRTALTGMGVTP